MLLCTHIHFRNIIEGKTYWRWRMWWDVHFVSHSKYKRLLLLLFPPTLLPLPSRQILFFFLCYFLCPHGHENWDTEFSFLLAWKHRPFLLWITMHNNNTKYPDIAYPPYPVAMQHNVVPVLRSWCKNFSCTEKKILQFFWWCFHVILK